MKSERERVAAPGARRGRRGSATIRADAERERTVLLADARATADKLRGQGEAQAIAIYADAFQRDPHFFRSGGRCRPIARPSPPALRGWC